MGRAHKILVVDDERGVRAVFERMLRPEGYTVESVDSVDAALDRMRLESFDLLLTDLAMPSKDGLVLLAELRARGDDTPAIVVTGAGTVQDAVRATKLGALDFLEKPVQLERLVLTVHNALRYKSLEEAHTRLRTDLGVAHSLVGDGPAMTKLKALIAKVAPSDGRVLIAGENGTGKEVVANAIHAGSPRANGPFVKLNCGAVSKELVESELFGHEKGAFTGAISARKGRFELADEGTLLLDEVGDMPMPMQVKLLRVLQEGQFERVGGTRTIQVSVRVLAASNRDIAALVASGEFREDLYYRLNVVTLRVPPLRDRREDVPAIVRHLLRTKDYGHTVTFEDGALEAMMRYDYPGNVRELQNLTERLAMLHRGESIEARHVHEMFNRGSIAPPPRRGPYQLGRSLRDLMHDVERQILVDAIEAHGGSKVEAAKALGTERSHFYKKCRQFGIGGEDT